MRLLGALVSIVLVSVLMAGTATASDTLYGVVYDLGTSAEKLVVIDTTSGALTTVGSSIPGCCWVSSGVSTYDPANDDFFFVGHYSADASGIDRIFTIDTATGTVTSDPILPSGNNYNFIEHGNGNLYAMIYDSGASVEKLVTIDPTTGTTSTVGSGIAGCCMVSSGVSTIDPAGNRFLFFGHYMADAAGTDRIFVIDTLTGAVTSDTVVPTGHNYNFLEYDQVGDALYAMVYEHAGALEKLVVVDPTAGTLTTVGSGISGCCMVPSGVSTFDPNNDRFYFVGHYTADTGIYRIFGIDTATGGVASEPSLPTGHNYNFIEFDPILAVNQAPEALCHDVTVAADTTCTADASIDAGSYDPDGDPITLTQDPPGPYAIGDTTVVLTVEDDEGLTDTCEATVTVENLLPTVVSCNAPATIIPPDAPIPFTATATNSCGGSATVEITGYDCYKYNRKGRRIDKTDSCEVAIDGATVTILDSGGVGDNIEWYVTVGADTTTCHVEVVNPGRGRGHSR
jgi:hypothetical protein